MYIMLIYILYYSILDEIRLYCYYFYYLSYAL